MELRKSEDAGIREIADYVYQNIFLYYTMKQWGQKPEEISEEVTGRVPVLISRDNGYFTEPLIREFPSRDSTGCSETC